MKSSTLKNVVDPSCKVIIQGRDAVKGGSVQILGVIHEDPFSYQTWSGTSYYFFSSLKNSNHLYKAISAEPPQFVSYLYKLLSFHPDMAKWKFKYHINTAYYKEMTKVALNKIKDCNDDEYNIILQIGAWYDLTRIKDKRTVSYHDGNLSALLKSPYGYPRIRRSIIETTLRYEKQLYAGMDHIFPMSQWLANSFIHDFDVDHRKVTPVGAGINLPYIRKVNAKNYDEPNILFVGKDWARKGGQYLLEAFTRVRQEVRHSTLTIVGPTIPSDFEGVKCTGHVAKSDTGGIETLLTEYSRASIFVMPSLYEPFGIVFAEAMAHKLPCVGTNICAIPEIIDNGVNGYVVPVKDSKVLATRMIDLLKNPGMCKEFGENAFNKYSQNYTWDVVTQKIIERLRSKDLQ